MLKKMCRCGAKIGLSEKRCSNCEERRIVSRKEYDRFHRKNAEIYHSTEWKQLTQLCKTKCNGLDIFALYEFNEIRAGDLSHHILEVDESRERIFDIDNLIYVSNQSHALIHAAYDRGDAERKKLQTKLFAYLTMWAEGV